MCKTGCSTKETWRRDESRVIMQNWELFMCSSSSSSSIQSGEILLLPQLTNLVCVVPSCTLPSSFSTFSISIFFVCLSLSLSVCLSVCGYRRLFSSSSLFILVRFSSLYISLPAHFRDRAPFATGQMFWLQATTVYMASKCTSVVQVKKERKKIYTAGSLSECRSISLKKRNKFSLPPYTTMIERVVTFCWAQLHSTHALASCSDLYIWHPSP